MNLIFAIFALASICYLGACVCAYFFNLTRAFYAFAAVAFAVQTGALIYLGAVLGEVPVSNAYALVEFIAWAIALLSLLVVAFAGALRAARIGILAAGCLTIFPLFCPVFSEKIFESVAAVSPNIAAYHAVFAVASYAFLCMSAMFSGAYLLQVRALKRKNRGILSDEFMPLPRVLRIARVSLAFACGCMAISIIAGIDAAFGLGESARLSAKFAAGGILFFMQTLLFVASIKKKFSGRVFARLCIALFLISILILIPVELGRPPL